MNEEPHTPKPHAVLPLAVAPEPEIDFEKAGVIVEGDIDGVPHMLATYTEGRFSSGIKCFGITKGSVDPGQNVFGEGLRESAEESGINLRKLLGKDILMKLREGQGYEDPVGFESKAYPGVRVLRVSPQMLDIGYQNRHGGTKRMALLKVTVAGIENLHPHLKNVKNAGAFPKKAIPVTEQVDAVMPAVEGVIPVDAVALTTDAAVPEADSTEVAENAPITLPLVQTTVKEKIAKSGGVQPTRAECIEWIIRGTMPTRPWAHCRLGEVLAVRAEYLESVNALRAKLKAQQDAVMDLQSFDTATSELRWQSWVANDWMPWVKALSANEKGALRHVAEKLKEVLKQLKVGKDEEELKFNAKDLSLDLYQEGGEILPTERLVEETIAVAADNPLFAKALGGVDGMDGESLDEEAEVAQQEGMSRVERWEKSQIAAVVWSSGIDDFKNVAERLAAHFELHPPKVIEGSSAHMFRADDDLSAAALEQDIKTIAEHTAGKTIPTHEVMQRVNHGRMLRSLKPLEAAAASAVTVGG